MNRQSHRMSLALAHMARTGCTATDAAARFKVSTQALNLARHRAGLEVAPRGRPRKAAIIAGYPGADNSTKD
jgi:hypothetical protein